MDLTRELTIAIDAAIKAGVKIKEIYDDYVSGNSVLDITTKSDNSPLTTADKESNLIIVSRLKDSFPQYAILSEESKDDPVRLKNKYCWIVDPLDGTKEYIKKNGEFTVNIALAYEQRVIAGVIYVPVTGELYYASKGNGAYYEKDGIKKRIRVSDRVEGLRMVMSRSHASAEPEGLINKYNIKYTRSAGSSLKGCLIAKGDAEVYYRFNYTMEWDTAAMHCIAEEAGAIFRQMDDSEMLYNREDSLNKKGFYIINRMENRMVL